MNTLLCIPTLNAGAMASALLASLDAQTRAPDQVLVIDSGSRDGTREALAAHGARVHNIEPSEFDHGGTRQLAVDLTPAADVIVFMTQDAVLATPESFGQLVAAFDDARTGAVGGRQIARDDASPIAAHARRFNYPAVSSLRSKADIKRLGIKAAFLSNAFAAYRRSALLEVGGFPSDILFGEDTVVAARMLLAGWTIAYRADATVRHSHDYGFVEEFKRYWDIGAFHAREHWFIEALGRPQGEGIAFVRSEMQSLLATAPWLIPSAMLRTNLKAAGYELGQREALLPMWLKRRLSMNRRYWRDR